MDHFGIICPNVPGHLNPMMALADAIRCRGHRVTFFLLGDPPPVVTDAGFDILPLGSTIFPANEYQTGFQRLGTLQGRAALNHTFKLAVRAAEAILTCGPAVVRSAGVTALIVDQVSFPGGTVADEVGIPFITVCNALLLNPDPLVPPFFTHWWPRQSWWAQLRNRIAWSGLNRLYMPILSLIQERRRQLNLPIHTRIADVWSSRLQISQQPEAFEFPRQELPKEVRFVGPLRLPEGYSPVPFPWERLDGRPLIYASLGTLVNRVERSFQVIAEACDGLDAQLVISTGRGLAPESLGELPGRPVVVSYAPQLELLRRSAVAVTHAGMNTVLEALSSGVPIVAMPVTNDQPGIAARIAWVGAGEIITQEQMSRHTLRTLVARVLSDPSYRTSAQRVQSSIQAGGGAPRAAELIDQNLALRI